MPRPLPSPCANRHSFSLSILITTVFASAAGMSMLLTEGYAASLETDKDEIAVNGSLTDFAGCKKQVKLTPAIGGGKMVITTPKRSDTNPCTKYAASVLTKLRYTPPSQYPQMHIKLSRKGQARIFRYPGPRIESCNIELDVDGSFLKDEESYGKLSTEEQWCFSRIAVLLLSDIAEPALLGRNIAEVLSINTVGKLLRIEFRPRQELACLADNHKLWEYGYTAIRKGQYQYSAATKRDYLDQCLKATSGWTNDDRRFYLRYYGVVTVYINVEKNYLSSLEFSQLHPAAGNSEYTNFSHEYHYSLDTSSSEVLPTSMSLDMKMRSMFLVYDGTLDIRATFYGQ